jgi:IPT/TIG domain
MKLITVRDLLDLRDLLVKKLRPARKATKPARSFRPMLESLEDRTVPTAVVSGLSVNTGLPSGGTPVMISGSGFIGATAVNFGATGAYCMVMSDTQIMSMSPSESAGTVDVTVTTPSGA